MTKIRRDIELARLTLAAITCRRGFSAGVIQLMLDATEAM